jgi:hypothetical protein
MQDKLMICMAVGLLSLHMCYYSIYIVPKRINIRCVACMANMSLAARDVALFNQGGSTNAVRCKHDDIWGHIIRKQK